jgi:phenylpropionate dioxygenase-like ring-hydroxylating dioxygenase large terminal subunit
VHEIWLEHRMTANDRLVDTERGLISRRIYSDEGIYREELDKIFRKTWICVGHESMLPAPGDYITNYIGEDRVIVWRDVHGTIRIFLNSCTHHGNQLCLYDMGRAVSVTCSYHGWTFNSEGKLTGVPFFTEAYLGDLDRSRWGLIEVPNVTLFGGLIFANWDKNARPLSEQMGELSWYFENILLVPHLGGLQAIPGLQRYVMSGNWKSFCDNFGGDHYHTPTTHASAIAQGVAGLEAPEGLQGKTGYFELTLLPAHNLGGIYTDDEQYHRDLARAQKMGAEVVEYVEHRHQLMHAHMDGVAAKPYGFSHGLCFPTLNMVGASNPFIARSFLLTHPMGPFEFEVWQWWMVEREAPKAVKELAAANAANSQAAAGLFGQDDSENFERIRQTLGTPISDSLPFHSGMSLGHDGEWPGQDEWFKDGLPGLVGPRFGETAQRLFYKHWSHLMGLDGR